MFEILAIFLASIAFLGFLYIMIVALGGHKKIMNLITKRSLELDANDNYNKMPSGKRFFIMIDSKRKKEISYYRDRDNSFRDLYDAQGKLIKTVNFWQMQLTDKTISDLMSFENVTQYYLVVDEESTNNYLRNELKAYKIDNFRLEQERMRLLARVGEYNTEVAKQKGKEYKAEYGDRKIVIMKNNGKKLDEVNNLEVE